MAIPANAAVRESKRRATPRDWERINVLKALSAAEHSRRQFILNFAASRDTTLLVPGQKADAVKAAEESVANWLSQSGYERVSSEFFKYTVDARLWSTHVGGELDFPFAFMRGKVEASAKSSEDAAHNDPEGEMVLLGNETDPGDGETTPVASPQTQSPRGSLKGRSWMKRHSAPSTPPARQQRQTGQQRSADVSSGKKRTMSLVSVEGMKGPKAATQERSPFLVRLGRSWSRRLSAAT